VTFQIYAIGHAGLAGDLQEIKIDLRKPQVCSELPHGPTTDKMLCEA